nr:MAG TPA: Concanavalin A-like lectin/glucanase superfamily protein [Bacteriophage sp.]
MAKYGKNNYFDGVILPEPKEEMLRRMAKGVDCTKGYLGSTDAGLLFDGPRSMECFFNLRQSDGTQRPAQFSTSMMAIAVTPMDAIMFHCGNKSLQVSRVTIGDDIHVVISYDGATAMCYINGIEVGAMQPTAYTLSALFHIGDPLHITKSPVHFCRHFNYALSAEEVVALYNNGDPMGYVVPKAMRELLSVNLIGSNSFTWDGSDSPYYYNITGNPITIGKYYKINVTVSDYQSGSPRIFTGISYPIPAQNGTFDIVVYNKRYVDNFPIYGGSDGDPNRHLTITVNSITSVGLLAEYLPHNLIPTAEGSVVKWLDSAPQLPEANGILPPLDASVGGYDLAAIGNPKIII